jgi:hypothetical protein
VKLTVLWQTLHGCVTGGCDVDIVTALIRLPDPWQTSHALGTPFKTPCTWQSSQRADWCAPVSGNPFARCWASAFGTRIAFCAAASPIPAISTIATSTADAMTPVNRCNVVSRAWAA